MKKGILTSGLLIVFLCLQTLGSVAMAESFIESGRKIIYLRETGSGLDGKHGAIKLDTPSSLEAGCFEDILLLDVSTAEGKGLYKELEELQSKGLAIKSISYTRDDEGDCHLEKLEK